MRVCSYVCVRGPHLLDGLHAFLGLELEVADLAVVRLGDLQPLLETRHVHEGGAVARLQGKRRGERGRGRQ